MQRLVPRPLRQTGVATAKEDPPALPPSAEGADDRPVHTEKTELLREIMGASDALVSAVRE